MNGVLDRRDGKRRFEISGLLGEPLTPTNARITVRCVQGHLSSLEWVSRVAAPLRDSRKQLRLPTALEQTSVALSGTPVATDSGNGRSLALNLHVFRLRPTTSLHWI